MFNHSNILKILNHRYACREFSSSKSITDEDFNIILEAGRLSPSAFALEPWKFIAVKSATAKERLKPADIKGGQLQLETCSHFIVILTATANLVKSGSHYITNMGKNMQGLTEEAIHNKHVRIKNFQDNDFKISHDLKYLEDWAAKQCYIALGNMMTIAAMLEIDTCPIEGFNKEKLTDILVKHFNLNAQQYQPAVCLALGYRVGDIRPKKRRTLHEVMEIF